MGKPIISIVIFAILFCSWGLQGQEEHKEESNEQEHSEHSDEHFHHNSITFLISHTFLSTGIKEGERSWIVVPSLGLNYNYRFNHKWSLGWHNDLIIESFVVEDNREEGGATLERELPLATMLVGTYKVTEGWGFALGGGIEIEPNENFGVIRVGTEYGIEIPERRLEVTIGLNYDILIDAYNSFNVGIGLSRLW